MRIATHVNDITEVNGDITTNIHSLHQLLLDQCIRSMVIHYMTSIKPELRWLIHATSTTSTSEKDQQINTSSIKQLHHDHHAPQGHQHPHQLRQQVSSTSPSRQARLQHASNIDIKISCKQQATSLPDRPGEDICV